MFIRSRILVDQDTTIIKASILKDPGKIHIILPDTLGDMKGFVFIQGTNIYKKVTEAHYLKNGFYSLTIDSIPEYTYPTLYYAKTGNKRDDPLSLTDTFVIHAKSTVKLEAFVTWHFFNKQNSGLPSNTVFDMAIDSNGTKWFATNKGAVKYTGKDWIVYNSHNSELKSDSVITVAVGRDGVLWFGTSYGVAKYDGINWTAYTSTNTSLENNFINDISPDDEGNIWVGTNYGVARFDTQSNWELFIDQLPSHEVYSIAVDHDGVKWFVTDPGGLVKLDGNSWYTYHTKNSGLISNRLYVVTVDIHGNKWIGGRGGIVKFDGISWKQIHTGSTQVAKYTIPSIAIDKNDSKYFGTYQGGSVYIYDETGLKIYDSESSIIPSHAYKMFSLVVDDNNFKWVTTLREGIYFFGTCNK